MIGELIGIPQDQGDGVVQILVGGVGYLVKMPSHQAMRCCAQKEARVYVHTAGKDGLIELFGFEDKETKELFLLLTSVTGIGGKTALSILGKAETKEIINAISDSDPKILISTYGIGKKHAERIVLELSSKVISTGSSKEMSEIAQALIALGYSQSEARKGAQEALTHKGTLEAKVTYALSTLHGS